MKEFWINKKNNKNLIIFFSGWGMDQNPFTPLKYNDLDILMYYNYSDINTNDTSLKNIINSEKYLNIYLIGFSLGVGVLGYLLNDELSKKVKKVIAINGTLEPIDDKKGIPKQIFENTIKFWNAENKINFIKRMCRDQATFNKYKSNLPERSLSDEKKELTNLYDVLTDNNVKIENYFDTVIISGNDRIFPAKNQNAYWTGKAKIIKYDKTPHFIFYNWDNWEDILKDVTENR
ncbi:MAG: DUF452 family protein [Candidatus Delongbacteria bacterium]|nr:DUF452 family protein [Candidatus Delongbacteria bacterium]